MNRIVAEKRLANSLGRNVLCAADLAYKQENDVLIYLKT